MWLLRHLVQLFRPGQVNQANQARQARRARQAGQASPERLAAYNTYDARNALSRLLARTARGEEIVIARSGVPIAKLVPYTGDPLRSGLIRSHVIVVPDEDSND